jgi:hypothetical protein
VPEAVATAVQVDPLCVIVIVFVAIVRVAVRAEKLFADAKTVVLPMPVPVGLFVTESQGALETTLQLHGDGSVIPIVRSPPFMSKAAMVGLKTGSVQEPAS